MARSLVNCENVTKAYGADPVLSDISLGLAAGDRVGVVGRNGAGKSTLLRILTGAEEPDSGRVTRTRDIRIGTLRQSEQYPPEQTVRERVLGGQQEHEWASQPKIREVLSSLVGGIGPDVLDRRMTSLSGGEQRRADLAALLIQDLDLLVLDEPTNHLDVAGVAWLAQYLARQRELAVLVVTHDRWLLDEVAVETWEVVDGHVERYEGGYAAFVLSKAERQRQARVVKQRRDNLLRKELAWLRRGAPARTSKPRYRVEAANELIADEPPPRNSVELLAFADSRLGKSVFELQDASLRMGEVDVLDRVSWIVGPGDRIGIVGVNGAGKTSLARVFAQEQRLDSGRLIVGKTVQTAFLSQHLEELNPTWRVLESVERVAKHVRLSGGNELSASQLCERLGFLPQTQLTPVGDLSGGERRRLQLTRLLMTGPNVLILDEPTNDYDIETLTALEDLLDSFGGTLLVISHDRYFLERVCDRQFAMLNGRVRDLPGGVSQYLSLVEDPVAVDDAPAAGVRPITDSARSRQLRKEVARAERTLEKLDQRVEKLHGQLAEHATDPERVQQLSEALSALEAEREQAEAAWFAAAEQLEE